MKLVVEKADEIKFKIKNVLKNKLIHLRIDTATRRDRAILGINAQIIIKKQNYHFFP